MPKVLVTPTIFRNLPGPYLETLKAGGFEVVYPPDGCDTMRRENLLPLLAGVDAMLASVEKMTPEVLAQTKLRAIARAGVGYDSIDIPRPPIWASPSRSRPARSKSQSPSIRSH